MIFIDFYDRLDTGWSSYRGNVYTNTKNRTLTDSEFMLIATVLQKRDLQQTQEQERIGYENGTFLLLHFQETLCFSKLHLTFTWSNARTFFSSFNRFGYYSLLIPRISCPHWLFLLIECLFLFYEFWEAFVQCEEAFVQCLYKIARKHAPSNLYALYENLSKVWKKVRPEKSLLAFNFCCY